MNKLALTIPGYTIDAPGGVPEGGTSSIETLIRFGVTALMITSTILCLFFLIYGGIKWITSGGDEKAIDSARKTITYAVIGLVVVLASFLILNFISAIFGVSYLPSAPAGGGGGPHPLPL